MLFGYLAFFKFNLLCFVLLLNTSVAMKQIYRPDYVYSHFVHYSTVTEFGARYYDPERLIKNIHEKFDESKEVFVDELNEGTLAHARSVVPRYVFVIAVASFRGNEYLTFL